jgi:hypothetical protein
VLVALQGFTPTWWLEATYAWVAGQVEGSTLVKRQREPAGFSPPRPGYPRDMSQPDPYPPIDTPPPPLPDPEPLPTPTPPQPPIPDPLPI